MQNENTITVKKNTFFVAVSVIIALVVWLIISTGQSTDADKTSTLLKALEGTGVAFLPAFGSDGKIKILAPNGKELEPCGRSEDGIITGDCDVEGISLKAKHIIQILLHTGSMHVCATINVNGTDYQVHAENDPAHATDHWLAGQRKCHNKHTAGSHYWP